MGILNGTTGRATQFFARKAARLGILGPAASEATRGGLGEVVRGSKLVVVQDARPKK